MGQTIRRALLPVHVRQDDRRHVGYLRLREVPGELLEHPDRALDPELVLLLEAGDQLVEDVRPLLGPVPLGDGGDRVGDGRTDLTKGNTRRRDLSIKLENDIFLLLFF